MPVNQIVVLMLENRGFDHLVGFMRSPSFQIDGLTGNEQNFPDPLGPSGTPVKVSADAPYVPDLDPGPDHGFPNVAVQLHGAFPPPNPSKGSNVGFVKDYSAVNGVTTPGHVMRCFADGKLPVLGTLAKEFAICDRWFSSMPGGTWPNRFFVHCATSGGFIDNALRNYPMRTLYQNLSDHGVDWRIYYHDMPQSLALANQRPFFRTKYETFDAFVRDCRNGLLPRYSFIEPRYFNELANRANDQHPIHGVIGGEDLIATVYEALRASPQWETTLLVVTWDEHGGFYDHVPPPAATPPDGATQSFDFASYGVRVPAVVVSPLIPKNTIDHTLYDHSSIPATAKNVFGLPQFLTKRDAAANTLERLCTLPNARTDTPATLPRPQAPAALLAAVPAAPAPTNDLQNDLLALARELSAPPEGLLAARAAPPPANEDAAAAEVRAHLAAFKLTAPG